MKLIVGLGNPGLRYRNTRHNMGYSVVGRLAKIHSIRIKKKIYKGLAGEGRIKQEEVLLLLPETFMNLSGESVILAKAEISNLSDLLIVCDDIDLLLGNMRFRAKGSSGGHKGLMSIIDKVKTEEFPRLRIGIRSEPVPYDASSFVLKPFLRNQRKKVDSIVKEAVSSIETWISSNIEECMTKYNRKNT